uniref:Uncharacterized protein n=1 Tax=Oryza nivara TaxID=4536 RepID=A0A0E0IJE8_ORYNI
MAMEAGAPRGAAATTSGGGGGAPEAGAELGSSGAPVTWGRVWRAGQEAAAHALLLCFTALLALKLDGLFRGSWWMCGALMPGHGETMTDEAIWERLPEMQLLWGGSSLGGLLMKIAKRSKLIYAMQIILERALISAGHAQFVE